MRKRRVVYRDWIDELDRDPVQTCGPTSGSTAAYNQEIITAVNRAMEALDEEERTFIQAFYFQGMSFRQIVGITGRPHYRLRDLHDRAVRRLKRRLSCLLNGRFNTPAAGNVGCPLCRHPDVDEINALIASKSKEETWRRVIRTLRDDFSTAGVTPQQIIGHRKYHIV